MKLWEEFRSKGYDSRGILLRLDMTDEPIEPLAMAAALGVDVFFVRYPDDGEKDGELHWTDQGEPQIYVNEAYPNRKRFTIAHELGHLFVGKSERKANAFAADILMPSWLVKEEVLKVNDISTIDLARKFKVSLQAMRIRLEVLGLSRWVTHLP